MILVGFEEHSLGEISDTLIEELDALPENSTNLVISDLADYRAWEPAAPHMEKANSERNCRFKILVGPIISANEYGRSALAELASKGHVELYVSYRLQGKQGRLFSLGANYEITGATYLQLEAPHEPLQSSIAMKRFKADDGIDRYDITRFLERFAFMAFTNSHFYPKSANPEEDFLILKEHEIRKAMEGHRTGTPFSFMGRRNIEQLLSGQQSLNLYIPKPNSPI